MRSRVLMTLLMFAVAIGAFVTGCAHDDADDSATATPAPAYPSGVLVDPANVADVRGLYPVASPTDGCCWAGPDVHFFTAAASDSHHLLLGVLEPNVGPFPAAKQSVSLLAPNGRVLATKSVATGSSTLDFAIPPGSAHDDKLEVRLHLGRSFVPKDYHINGDTRRLSLLVVSVATE